MTQRGSDPGTALGFLRFQVVESSINTLTESKIQTPTSPASLIAMRLWKVVWKLSQPIGALPAADDMERLRFEVSFSTRQDQTSRPQYEDSGTLLEIVADTMVASAPADAGLGVGIAQHPSGFMDYGPFGLLIPTQTISVYIIGDGVNAVGSIRGIMFYTLDKITPAELVAALSVTTDV